MMPLMFPTWSPHQDPTREAARMVAVLSAWGGGAGSDVAQRATGHSLKAVVPEVTYRCVVAMGLQIVPF